MLSLRIRRFITSTLFRYISAEFLGVIISFLISTYILVYLGTKELGQFSLYMILIGLFSSISQGAANSYLIKNFFKYNQNKIVSSVNITMAIFSLFSLLIYMMTEIFLSTYYYTPYFIFFAILKAYNSTFFVLMRVNEDADSFLVWSLSYKSIYSIPVMYLIFTSTFTLENLLLILFINELFFYIILCGFSIIKYKLVFSLSKRYLYANLRLSKNLFPHKIFKTIYENIDKYAIQIVLGAEVLGVYSMILRLASPIHIFIKASNHELSIIMSKVYASKISIDILLNTERKIFFILFFINVATIVFATLYHSLIYDFGDGFYLIYLLVLIYVNMQVLYYCFYNENFYLGKRLIYYIRFFAFSLISFLLLLFHFIDIYNLLIMMISVELFVLSVLYLSIIHETKLVLSRYLLFIILIITVTIIFI